MSRKCVERFRDKQMRETKGESAVSELKSSLRASGAEIVHEGRMDGGLALFACVANALGNRTETSNEAGQEIAVEKFLYGTHGSLLILFFVSWQHIFCASCYRNGQFYMTVMRQCMA